MKCVRKTYVARRLQPSGSRSSVTLALGWPAMFGGALCAVALAAAHTPMRLTTADGFGISAAYFAAPSSEPSPAVVLVHGAGGRKEDWVEAGLPVLLLQRGVHVLAIDLRDHGTSDRQPEGVWSYPYPDIEAAVAWRTDQPTIDADRIGLAGASFGANLVVVGTLTRAWAPKAIAALSATSAALDWMEGESINRLPPILLLGSRDDARTYGVTITARELARHSGAPLIRMVDGRVHGTNLVSPLGTEIADWFADRLAL